MILIHHFPGLHLLVAGGGVDTSFFLGYRGIPGFAYGITLGRECAGNQIQSAACKATALPAVLSPQPPTYICFSLAAVFARSFMSFSA